MWLKKNWLKTRMRNTLVDTASEVPVQRTLWELLIASSNGVIEEGQKRLRQTPEPEQNSRTQKKKEGSRVMPAAGSLAPMPVGVQPQFSQWGTVSLYWQQPAPHPEHPFFRVTLLPAVSTIALFFGPSVALLLEKCYHTNPFHCC